ncbi:hypothetical protein N9B31_01380 [Mariniblastus sp.]|nr:hypothetical protein [bacterium]MDA7902288.1 hypothetical protein [Mariniblastus sp.]MDA7906339.1 hypothetical protein [Mariniblastus sp.]MDB4380374.1 hypothetical protein [Mariniblastus sp.]
MLNERWQAEIGVLAEGTHFRLMVPVNERGREHLKLSASNHGAMVNLVRTPNQVENEFTLLTSTIQEMGVISKYR